MWEGCLNEYTHCLCHLEMLRYKSNIGITLIFMHYLSDLIHGFCGYVESHVDIISMGSIANRAGTEVITLVIQGL